MTKTLMLFAAALPALSQQGFDFKSLDKLGVNAKESTNVTLDGDTLKLASGIFGNDDPSMKSLVDNLRGIYVRSYEFEKTGQYDVADLAPLRAYLKSPRWNKVVEVKETTELSEIYIQKLPNNKLGGVAIINAEPMEVTVVYINGILNVSDLARLGGNMGIPDMTILHGGGRPAPKSGDTGKDRSGKDGKDGSGKDQKE
jgi:hypothetical protein